jgi:hypothetical protein
MGLTVCSTVCAPPSRRGHARAPHRQPPGLGARVQAGRDAALARSVAAATAVARRQPPAGRLRPADVHVARAEVRHLRRRGARTLSGGGRERSGRRARKVQVNCCGGVASFFFFFAVMF